MNCPQSVVHKSSESGWVMNINDYFMELIKLFSNDHWALNNLVSHIAKTRD